MKNALIFILPLFAVLFVEGCADTKKDKEKKPHPVAEMSSFQPGVLLADICLGPQSTLDPSDFLTTLRENSGQAVDNDTTTPEQALLVNTDTSTACQQKAMSSEEEKPGSVFFSPECTDDIKEKYSEGKTPVDEQQDGSDGPSTTITAETVVICGDYKKEDQDLRIFADQLILKDAKIQTSGQATRDGLLVIANSLSLSGKNYLKTRFLATSNPREEKTGPSLVFDIKKSVTLLKKNDLLSLTTSVQPKK